MTVLSNRRKVARPSKPFDLRALVDSIRDVDAYLATQAGKVVNISLTLRNWMIGVYIAEYELRGADRAEYGDSLLEVLAKHLTKEAISNCNHRQLYRYLRFYRLYPGILGTLSPKSRKMLPDSASFSRKVGTPSPKSALAPKLLVERLSYSQIESIVDLDDPLKRAFYEIECVRGNWSVRELKRQIGSLYYERSGLSWNKKKLSALAHSKAEASEPRLAIRDPYVFEFLGLKAREAMRESDLEDALLDKLQDFLLELGDGFCFEARQKDIRIGKTRGYVDLVFYHRILKCHVLVELKLAPFRHEHIGQLNTYVSWYRKNIRTEGDNPPIGILLCTDKDHALVEYALAGIPNTLFVSQYQLKLPKTEEIRRFLEAKIKELGE